LRIVDATRRLWRAPEARFDADEIGLEAFAWNIENRHLIASLEARAAGLPNLHLIGTTRLRWTAISTASLFARQRGDIVEAKLAVGADGKNSLCRTAAGIEVQSVSYPQIALTYSVSHSRPHRDISTEFHTEQGPFTTVPLPGNRSSIVCVVSPAGGALYALDDDGLDRELERRSHSILGKIKADARPRRVSAGGDRAPLCGRTHRACRRSRAPLPADRRAGPQSRAARCRGDCGDRGRSSRRSRSAEACAATTASGAPTS
jgi:2-octaprenyl-6-methoxyphenol hydroxylase